MSSSFISVHICWQIPHLVVHIVARGDHGTRQGRKSCLGRGDEAKDDQVHTYMARER